MSKPSIYTNYTKPVMGKLSAFLLLATCVPVFTVLAIPLVLVNKGKIFYRQNRIGLNSKPFIVYKLMTMSNVTNEFGELLPDNVRTHRLGKYLRTMHIDELPQLLNIIKGDMAFIGPRPLLPDYLPLYTNNQLTRHNVKPGVTGLAQVQGGNSLSWNHRLRLDAEYAKSESLALDILILGRTVKYFISGLTGSKPRVIYSCSLTEELAIHQRA
ncbi:MAG: sugar transferase [Bacteroidota bacterium]|nr:sugar transferase [Bacteroidota bacterium]